MIKKELSGILLIGLLSATLNANSAIIYQADNRYINHVISGMLTPSVDYADFNVLYKTPESTVDQNTQVSSSGMSGYGSADVYWDSNINPYATVSSSVFSVSFSVDRLTDFSLTGSITTLLASYNDTYINLSENGVDLFTLNYNTGLTEFDNPFSYDGQFIAGNDYQLVLSASTLDGAGFPESWNFDLQTTPVPVPAALWLFGSGLIALTGFTRKKHSKI